MTTYTLTSAERTARLRELLTRYGIDPDDPYSSDTDSMDEDETPDRFLCITRSTIDRSRLWSTGPTAERALRYAEDSENVTDWWPEALFDLDGPSTSDDDPGIPFSAEPVWVYRIGDDDQPSPEVDARALDQIADHCAAWREYAATGGYPFDGPAATVAAIVTTTGRSTVR